jgi:catechol 2,3-dioxygenase-like lactoylglutathione lyase family enzyme
MQLMHDIAHLGHAELLTPEPEKSLWFFTQVLGLTENGASGDSVYLRAWGRAGARDIARRGDRDHRGTQTA